MLGEFWNFSGGRKSQVAKVEESRRDDAVRTRVINARYGLHGVRVGEASRPGATAKRRRRVGLSSVQSCVDGQGFVSSNYQREADVPQHGA